MRGPAIYRYLLLTFACSCLGWNGQVVLGQATATTEWHEDKSIVFIIEGMTTPQDALVTEELLFNEPGILRSRTNFYTKMSSVVTATGFGIDEKAITNLIEKAGFTISQYNEYKIGEPSKRQVKQGIPVQNAQPPSSAGQGEKVVVNNHVESQSSIEEKIKFYEKWRAVAIEKGTPTKKYDDELNRLKAELKK